MSQVKEQDKITARDLNGMEVSNIRDKEFKLVVIKILPGLEKRVEDLSETLNKEIKKEPIRDEHHNKFKIH